MQADNPQHIWYLMARKLSGEATSEELLELEALLRNNPEANYSKEILNDLWVAEPATDNQHAEQKFKELVTQIRTLGLDDGRFADNDHYLNTNIGIQRKPVKKQLVAGASIIVFLGLIAFMFYPGSQNETAALADMPAKNEVTTKNGSKSSLRLPDGTKVWLNAGSELAYEKDYGSKLREVSLKGEAYFDVVKNANKPFIIHTAGMDIKVIGTAFNVKCYPGEKTTETSLVRGSIEVSLKNRQEKILLKPNEKLVVNLEEENRQVKSGNMIAAVTKPMISLSHLTINPRDSAVVETAWLQNKLIFSSETFEEIALKMERWYAVKIIFSAEALKAIRFTGTIENESVREALDAMQFTTPSFAYTIKNDTITISANAKMKHHDKH